jgi:hypothetical protein
MVLAGYFDESERFEPSEPISVAGYIFKPRGYKHFVRKWERMLESAGRKPTTHFHMTTLYARTEEYEGWSVEDRAEVLRQAVDAVRKHAYCGVCVMFSQSEFEALAPARWQHRYGSIYTGACQMALRVTGYWMKLHNCQDPIAYAFESGHKFWTEANAILTSVGQHEDLKSMYRYHSHTAIDKKKAYGLQAADMLAWTMARMKVGAPDNHTMNAFAPIIWSLVKGKNDRYQIFHPEGDLLRRLFAEQIDRQGESIIVDLPKARVPKLR